MKENSITYKLLQFADCQAYDELHYKGSTTVCAIMQGLIKAFFIATGHVVVFTFLTLLAASVVYVIGSMLAFISIPVLTALGIEHIFSAGFYTYGLIMLFCVTVASLITGIITSWTGGMKVVPAWMKSDKTQQDKQPHWISLWLKGVKDKVCYVVKLDS